MGQKGQKKHKGLIFFHATNPQNRTKKMNFAKSNYVQCWKDTAYHTHANKKLNNIENNLKMPYLHFISTKLDSKSGQIKGLDVTFQMHYIAKIFDMVKYLKKKIEN